MGLPRDNFTWHKCWKNDSDMMQKTISRHSLDTSHYPASAWTAPSCDFAKNYMFTWWLAAKFVCWTSVLRFCLCIMFPQHWKLELTSADATKGPQFRYFWWAYTPNGFAAHLVNSSFVAQKHCSFLSTCSKSEGLQKYCIDTSRASLSSKTWERLQRGGWNS